MRFSFLFISGVLLSSGCAVSDDPGEGGFIGGVYGLSSGAYDKRIEEREQNLETLRQIRTESATEQVELQTEKQDLDSQLAELQIASTQLEQDIRQLSAQIDTMQARTTRARQKKQQLTHQQQALQRDLTSLQSKLQRASHDSDLSRYQAEEQRLRSEINDLKQSLLLNDLE